MLKKYLQTKKFLFSFVKKNSLLKKNHIGLGHRSNPPGLLGDLMVLPYNQP